jgi:hypothetical protein
MGKRADFLMLVQTTLLHENLPGRIAPLAQAMLLAEEAIPNDIYTASQEFVAWQLKQCAMPKWVVEWEENKKAREEAAKLQVKIAVNYEADADSWWHVAEAVASDLPETCRPIVCDRVEFIVVNTADAAAFHDWGTQIPGWDPECPPFLISSVREEPTKTARRIVMIDTETMAVDAITKGFKT